MHIEITSLDQHKPRENSVVGDHLDLREMGRSMDSQCFTAAYPVLFPVSATTFPWVAFPSAL